MDRKTFFERASRALQALDDRLGGLEHEALDVNLAGDVLTLQFSDGVSFVINAHSAAGQIWMAANRDAWHFDFDADTRTWIAAKSGDELLSTVSRVVGEKLGESIDLS